VTTLQATDYWNSVIIIIIINKVQVQDWTLMWAHCFPESVLESTWDNRCTDLTRAADRLCSINVQDINIATSVIQCPVGPAPSAMLPVSGPSSSGIRQHFATTSSTPKFPMFSGYTNTNLYIFQTIAIASHDGFSSSALSFLSTLGEFLTSTASDLHDMSHLFQRLLVMTYSISIQS